MQSQQNINKDINSYNPKIKSSIILNNNLISTSSISCKINETKQKIKEYWEKQKK